VLYLYRGILLFFMALFLGTLFFDVEERLDNMQDVAGALFYALWVRPCGFVVRVVSVHVRRAGRRWFDNFV